MASATQQARQLAPTSHISPMLLYCLLFTALAAMAERVSGVVGVRWRVAMAVAEQCE
jgi:hypothetical protein